MREELLSVIERNSRIDLKELAVILGVDEQRVLDELTALEKEGVICGYHTLINWEKTPTEKVSALIEVRVTPQRGQGFDHIAERIYNYLHGNTCVRLYPGCLYKQFKAVCGIRNHEITFCR